MFLCRIGESLLTEGGQRNVFKNLFLHTLVVKVVVLFLCAVRYDKNNFSFLVSSPLLWVKKEDKRNTFSSSHTCRVLARDETSNRISVASLVQLKIFSKGTKQKLEAMIVDWKFGENSLRNQKCCRESNQMWNLYGKDATSAFEFNYELFEAVMSDVVAWSITLWINASSSAHRIPVSFQTILEVLQSDKRTKPAEHEIE